MEARLERMEATVGRLAMAVEGVVDAVAARVADAIADARPLVLTKAQLRQAVRAAMQENAGESVEKEAEDAATPPPRKKTKKTKSVATVEPDLPSPSSLTLSMFVDTMASEATLSPPPANTKRAVPIVVPTPPLPAPVHRPPPVAKVAAPVTTVPMRPTMMAIPMPMPSPRQLQQQYQQQQQQQQQQFQQRQQVHAVTPKVSSKAPSPPIGGRLYLWGNAWHHLPEDYEFPKESLEVMWRQWCCGVSERGFRPLREIQASDIATTNNRKRLSDLKFLMKFLEQQLQDRGVWKELPSEIEADQMLRAVSDSLPFTPTMGKNGLKREVEGLKWHSAVTILRNANKKARAE